MKLIDRYEFTNGKRFETYYLDANDTYLNDAPECDVIGLLRVGERDSDTRMTLMRPDEALIQARMLIDAVQAVTEGYAIGLSDETSRANNSTSA